MNVEIGFVVAMKNEAKILASFLGLTLKEEQNASYLIYANSNTSIVIITPGIDADFLGDDKNPVSRVGKVSAAVVTTILIEKYQPEMIINCGTAAGIAIKGVEIGDIVVADFVANHDIHIPFTEYEAYGKRKISLTNVDKFNILQLPFKSGTVSSGESFTSTHKEWDTMLSNNAYAKEMEAAGVMQAVQILNYTNPVYVIKAVTDKEEENTPGTTQAEDFVKNFDLSMNNLGRFVQALVENKETFLH